MSPLAIALVCLSAVSHAGWNALGKRASADATFFLLSGLAVVPLAPALWWWAPPLAEWPLPLLWILPATGLCQALYLSALAGAYRAGDMSVAYPLLRSLPVVAVALVRVLLGDSDKIAPVGWIAIALILIGGSMLPIVRWTELSWRRYANRCCGLAVAAAIGTTGYTLLDDVGVRSLGGKIGWQRAAAVYTVLEAASTSTFLAIWIACSAGERRSLSELSRHTLLQAVVAGGVLFGTYGLVLAAMAIANHVSYVIALRQLSIPIATAIGVGLLGEQAAPPRLLGSALIFGGLVALALS